MDVLAGVIIGMLLMFTLGKRKIDININTNVNRVNEEILPPLPDMETLSDAMNKADANEDKAYKDVAKGIMDEFNEIFRQGGDLDGK